MAIAQNFRRYAEAMLYQLELPLQGYEKTVQYMKQFMPGFVRSVMSGTYSAIWARSKFLPEKPRPTKRPADAVIWHQVRLWLYVGEELALF